MPKCNQTLNRSHCNIIEYLLTVICNSLRRQVNYVVMGQILYIHEKMCMCCKGFAEAGRAEWEETAVSEPQPDYLEDFTMDSALEPFTDGRRA